MEEKDLISKILDEVEYEKKLYEILAGTTEYDVIYFDSHTQYVKEELQRKAIEAQCERDGLKVMYRISYGTYAVVVAKDDHSKVAVVPEDNADGWFC